VITAIGAIALGIWSRGTIRTPEVSSAAMAPHGG
jgi:hypothetical protein